MYLFIKKLFLLKLLKLISINICDCLYINLIALNNKMKVITRIMAKSPFLRHKPLVEIWTLKKFQ